LPGLPLHAPNGGRPPLCSFTHSHGDAAPKQPLSFDRFIDAFMISCGFRHSVHHRPASAPLYLILHRPAVCGNTRLEDLLHSALIAQIKTRLLISVGAVCAANATNAADVPFAGSLTICEPFSRCLMVRRKAAAKHR
jgi:hypothetical protein